MSKTPILKTHDLIEKFNNKRIIEITRFTGTDEDVITTIRKGFEGTILCCNSIQHDVYFELYHLDDNGVQIFGLMYDEYTSPFEEETVKVFFITQLATMSGLFFIGKDDNREDANKILQRS